MYGTTYRKYCSAVEPSAYILVTHAHQHLLDWVDLSLYLLPTNANKLSGVTNVLMREFLATAILSGKIGQYATLGRRKFR